MRRLRTGCRSHSPQISSPTFIASPSRQHGYSLRRGHPAGARREAEGSTATDATCLDTMVDLE